MGMIRRQILAGLLALAALLSLASFGLTGCAGPGADLPPLPAAPQRAYRLGAGDQVRILVYGEDQLSGEYRVNDTGGIALPLIGSIRAAGSSTAELESTVAGALKKSGMLRDPTVAAEVIAYRPIFVLGEVNKPGQYPYQPGMTVVTAVAVAGGFTYRAIDDYAAVIRIFGPGTPGGRAVEGRAARQDFVQPGDVITIYERRF
jgi:polysaccharide biosynthesis/export protein